MFGVHDRSEPAEAETAAEDTWDPAETADWQPPKKRFRWGGDTALEEEKPTLSWVRGLGEVDPYSDIHVKVGKVVYQAHRFLLGRDSEFFDKAARWPRKTTPNQSSSSKGVGIGASADSGAATSSTTNNNATDSESVDPDTLALAHGGSSPGGGACVWVGELGEAKASNTKSVGVANGNTNTNADTNVSNVSAVGGDSISDVKIEKRCDDKRAGCWGKRALDAGDTEREAANEKGECGDNDTKSGIFMCDISDLLPVICLEKSDIFEKVLEYIYSVDKNAFVIPPWTAFFMLKVSDILGIKALFERCSTALEIYAAPYCVDLLEQAQLCCLPSTDANLEDLDELCYWYVVELFGPLTYTVDRRAKMFNLPIETQRRILSAASLGVAHEDLVVTYVREYLKRKPVLYDWKLPEGGNFLWENISWSEVSDECLKACSNESVFEYYIGLDAVRKFVLPEMRNRLGGKRESGNQEGEASGRTGKRKPLARYYGKDSEINDPNILLFYVDIVCPTSAPDGENTDVVWGAVWSAYEAAKKQGIATLDIPRIVQLPPISAGVVSKQWVGLYNRKEQEASWGNHWSFLEQKFPLDVGFLDYRVCIFPARVFGRTTFLATDEEGYLANGDDPVTNQNSGIQVGIEVTTPVSNSEATLHATVSVCKGSADGPWRWSSEEKDVNDTVSAHRKVVKAGRGFLLPLDEVSQEYFHESGNPGDNVWRPCDIISSKLRSSHLLHQMQRTKKFVMPSRNEIVVFNAYSEMEWSPNLGLILKRVRLSKTKKRDSELI